MSPASLTLRRLDVAASESDSAFRFRYCDHDKAKWNLEWEPPYAFQQTIADAQTWMKSRGLN